MNDFITVFGDLSNLRDYTCLAFDVGRSQTGLAIGNSISRLGQPLAAIEFEKFFPKSWNEIEQVIADWQVKLIIVGEPKDTPNTARKMRGFAKNIHARTSLPTVLLDESYTTAAAKQALSKKVAKSAIDSYSAMLLIEQWFAINV